MVSVGSDGHHCFDDDEQEPFVLLFRCLNASLERTLGDWSKMVKT